MVHLRYEREKDNAVIFKKSCQQVIWFVDEFSMIYRCSVSTLVANIYLCILLCLQKTQLQAKFCRILRLSLDKKPLNIYAFLDLFLYYWNFIRLSHSFSIFHFHFIWQKVFRVIVNHLDLYKNLCITIWPKLILTYYPPHLHYTSNHSPTVSCSLYVLVLALIGLNIIMALLLRI